LFDDHEIYFLFATGKKGKKGLSGTTKGFRRQKKWEIARQRERDGQTLLPTGRVIFLTVTRVYEGRGRSRI